MNHLIPNFLRYFKLDIIFCYLFPGAAAGGSASSQAAAGQADVIWVMLAVVVRLVLDTEYSWCIKHNCILPYILTLVTTYQLGYVSPPPASTASSLLSAGILLVDNLQTSLCGT